MKALPKNSQKYIIIVVLIFISGLLYTRSVSVSFSSDDYIHLSKNIYFNDAIDALNVFLEFDGREYRPTVRYSLWLNYLISKNAIPFKITNIVFHIGCVILVFFVLLIITNSQIKSFFGALIFCVLPIHSSSVNFIMGRTDIFCAFFYLLSLLFLLKSQEYQSEINIKYYIACIASFLLALTSKEMAVTLPLVGSLLLYLFPCKGDSRNRLSGIIHKTSFLWVVAIVYVILRVIFWAQTPESVDVYTSYSIAHVIKNYFLWLFAMIYPADLYFARHNMQSHTALFFIISFLAIAVVLLFLRYTINDKSIVSIIKHKIVLFGIMWFVITLLPITGGNAHRWYLYLPSVSLSFIMIGLLDLTKKQRKGIFIAFSSLLLLAFSFELIFRTNNWSMQDAISRGFISKIEDMKIYDEDEFYLINAPFGYRNTYLFTWDSLSYALLIFHGNRPKIHYVSYLNVDDNKPVQYDMLDSKMVVSLNPNQYRFVLFNQIQRRFSEGEVIRVKDLTVKILSVDEAGLVKKYEVFFPKENQIPVLFYDGNSFISL